MTGPVTFHIAVRQTTTNPLIGCNVVLLLSENGLKIFVKLDIYENNRRENYNFTTAARNNYLRCHIIGSSTKSICHPIQEDLQFAHSKIRYSHVTVEVQKYVVQLQISEKKNYFSIYTTYCAYFIWKIQVMIHINKRFYDKITKILLMNYINVYKITSFLILSFMDWRKFRTKLYISKSAKGFNF